MDNLDDQLLTETFNRKKRAYQERYHQGKQRFLLNNLRHLLPKNTNPLGIRKKKTMSKENVLRHAAKYIQILTDTIAANDFSQYVAEQLMLDGKSLDAQLYLQQETTKQQHVLDERIEKEIVLPYGLQEPTLLNEKTASIGQTFARVRQDAIECEPFVVTRKTKDALGHVNDPSIAGLSCSGM